MLHLREGLSQRLGLPLAGYFGSGLARGRKQFQAVIAGGVSLEAAPPSACHDHAEAVLFLVNSSGDSPPEPGACRAACSTAEVGSETGASDRYSSIPVRAPGRGSLSLGTAVTDPVGQGFVATLARPGGNITGFAL